MCKSKVLWVSKWPAIPILRISGRNCYPAGRGVSVCVICALSAVSIYIHIYIPPQSKKTWRISLSNLNKSPSFFQKIHTKMNRIVYYLAIFCLLSVVTARKASKEFLEHKKRVQEQIGETCYTQWLGYVSLSHLFRCRSNKVALTLSLVLKTNLSQFPSQWWCLRQGLQQCRT